MHYIASRGVVLHCVALYCSAAAQFYYSAHASAITSLSLRLVLFSIFPASYSPKLRFAMQCNAMRCDAMRCNAMQCIEVRGKLMIRNVMIQRNMIQCNTMMMYVNIVHVSTSPRRLHRRSKSLLKRELKIDGWECVSDPAATQWASAVLLLGQQAGIAQQRRIAPIGNERHSRAKGGGRIALHYIASHGVVLHCVALYCSAAQFYYSAHAS